MTNAEFLLKLADLSLTGFLIFLLYRAMTRFLPPYVSSQQDQAMNMGRLAASVDMYSHAMETHQATLLALQQMQQEQTKAMTAMLDMFKNVQAENLQAHKMLTILVRGVNEKLEAKEG